MGNQLRKIELLLIILATIVSLYGCKKEDKPFKDGPNIESFLLETKPLYQGKTDGLPFKWQSDFVQYSFQMFVVESGSNQNNLEKLVGCRLSSSHNSNYFEFSFPVDNNTSQQEFDQIFELGPKNLGEKNEDLHIEVRKDDVIYYACDLDNNITIELIKFEETTEHSPPQFYLNAWYKISNFDFNECGGGNSYAVKNVLVLAQFLDYRE
jgi:hypothetical protein